MDSYSTTTRYDTEDNDPRSRLAAELIEACHQAHEVGLPVLARIHVRLPNASDPWKTAAPYLDEETPCFFWNDGTDGLCAAAIGALDQKTLSSSTRFREARFRCHTLFDQVLDVSWDGNLESEEVYAAMPAVFTAFTFDEKHSKDITDTSSLLVPALMIHKRTNMKHCEAVLQLFATNDTDVEEEVKACAQLIESLCSNSEDSYQHHNIQTTTRLKSTDTDTRDEVSSWTKRIDAARQAIQSSPLKKVVLARQVTLTAPRNTTFDPLTTLYTLRSQHPTSTTFGLTRGTSTTTPNPSWFLGSTPETLIRSASSTITTHAVAGTAPRGHTQPTDHHLGRTLLQSSKDRHEHLLVANAIHRALTPLCSTLHRSGTHLLRLPHLQHLKTDFTGELRADCHVLNLVERLHPTPAVGGWPAATAKEWLRENDGEVVAQYGCYAAPVGWVSTAGDGVFAVAIRSAVMCGGTVKAFAGAGIVADSDPVAEWRETELKLRTVREALRVKEVVVADEVVVVVGGEVVVEHHDIKSDGALPVVKEVVEVQSLELARASL